MCLLTENRTSDMKAFNSTTQLELDSTPSEEGEMTGFCEYDFETSISTKEGISLSAK